MKIYQPMLFVGLGGTGGRIGAELERGLRRELCGPDGTNLVAAGRRGPVPGQRDPRSGWSRPGDGDRHGERHSERTPPHPDEHPAGARTWDPNF